METFATAFADDEDLQTMYYDVLNVLVISGPDRVGKSQLLSQFIDQNTSPLTLSYVYVATIGVDFRTRSICSNNRHVRLQIWDLGGQPRFRAIGKSYLCGARGVAIVFDVMTNALSLESVAEFYSDLRDDCCVVIVGNKCMSPGREVPFEVGESYARTRGARYFETDVVNDPASVERMFHYLVRISVNKC